MSMLCAAFTFADDPKPVPTPTPTPIVVPTPAPTPVPNVENKLTPQKEVSGMGSKADPYIFTTSTRVLLTLNLPEATNPKPKVDWDLEDAPPDTLVLDDKYVTWSLYKAGDFQIIAHGSGLYSKVWVRVQASKPDPTPVPPGPNPPPNPTPVPTGKLWVVIVEESDNLTTVPSSILLSKFSQKVREYCYSHCVKNAKGVPEFKVYDDDQDIADSGESAEIKDAFKAAVADRKAKNTDVPWIVISNGKDGYSGPLSNEEDTLKLLKQYGGE